MFNSRIYIDIEEERLLLEDATKKRRTQWMAKFDHTQYHKVISRLIETIRELKSEEYIEEKSKQD